MESDKLTRSKGIMPRLTVGSISAAWSFPFLFFLFICMPVITQAADADEADSVAGLRETVKIDEAADWHEDFNTDDFDNANEIIVYGEGYIPLDMNAFVYIFADIVKMRPIFDIIPVKQLKSWQATLVIDKTEIAVAALFPSVTGRTFQIVGFGSYPSFGANMALLLNKNWKFMFAKKNYYYSNNDRLSVRLSPQEIYAVGWRSVQVSPMPKEPGVKMPVGFNTFRHRYGEAAPLSLWMENYDSVLDETFKDEGITVNIPVERLFLNLYHAENKLFKAEIILQARSIFSWKDFEIKSSSKNSKSVYKKLFLANPYTLKGRSVEFQSALLSEEEIAVLMKTFIRYWR